MYGQTSFNNGAFVNMPGLSTDTVLAPAAVPEPSSLALCGIAGAIGLVVAQVRRKRQA